MDFFNSLSEVAKNNKNFKTWEEKQADTQAQREALYKKRQYSKEEIEHAKQLGDRIIDVVDIMDNHSESVAENVETAVQPIVGMAPVLVPLPVLVHWFKKTIPNADKAMWEAGDKHLYDNPKARELVQKITEDIHKTRPNKSDFELWHLKSKKKINKIANSELKAQAMEIYNAYHADIKPHLKKIKGGMWTAIGLSTASFIAANLLAANLQVDSSKIARYQARKLLEDPKAFVNYTPEQIAAAKKYIEEHPELKKEKKKDKLKTGMFSSIINLFKDRKAYKEAKKANTDESRKVTRTLTPDELVAAKKDKEVIQRSVRIINNEAEKYSENMEVAAGIILGSTPIVGGTIGWLTGVLMNKTGFTDKMVANIVKKHGTESAQEAYKRFKELKVGAPGYSVRWTKFVDKFMEDAGRVSKTDLAQNAEDLAKQAGKAKKGKEITAYFKKLFAVGMSHKWGNSKIIGLAGALLSSIPAALIALKLQKSSARAGRYTAKRELEKDPRNFIGYTEDDFNEVKDVKGEKQTFGKKLKEYALFVPTVLKQYYAYDKYRRTEFKDHQLMLDQLQKSEVSDEQLRDAKNLQRKLFNTFEKVDDNSQIYSESMEAAVEILQPFAMSAGMLTMISPLIYTGVQYSRGKISAASLLNSLTGKLSNASKFLNSKTFKKYLNDVAEKIPHKVGNFELKNKPLAGMISGISIKDDTIGEIGEKLVGNLRNISDNFRQMHNYQQVNLLSNLEKMIKEPAMMCDIQDERLNKIFGIITKLKSDEYNPRVRANMLDLLTNNTKSIERMNEYEFDTAISKFVDLYCDYQGPEKVARFARELAGIAEGNPDLAPFVKRFYGYYGQPDGGRMTIFDMKKFKQALVDSVDKETYVAASKVLNANLSAMFSKENFPYKVSDIMNDIDKVTAEWQSRQRGMNPERLIEGAAEASKEKGWIERLKNPKKAIEAFRAKVEKMSDQEFINMVDRANFSSMDKKTLLEILDKTDKILDNIPKDELAKIGQALAKEFKEHPDEFMRALSSGSLFSAFMTDSLVKTAAAVGISWTALNVAMMWIIQTWLADIQLKAGRLGVMKAIESLDDPAYYADIEPAKSADKNQSQPAAQTVTAPAQPQSSNLLKKFAK